MRLRLKPVLTMLVTTGMLAGMLGFAQVAHAALTPPPFEPDPNARGCLNFYGANGNLVTSGDVNAAPPVAFALGDGPSRAGDNSGTLYGAIPEPGVPSTICRSTSVASSGSRDACQTNSCPIRKPRYESVEWLPFSKRSFIVSYGRTSGTI